MITRAAIDEVQAALEDHPHPTRHWVVGAPWFDPPHAILDRLRQACDARSFAYPPVQGLEALRCAVGELHRREGLDVSPEQVVVTHGAKGGVAALLGCLLEPGSELLHPTPSYPAYAAIARTLGASAVAIEQPGGRYTLTSQALEQARTSRTRAVILSSPCNPTGAVLSGEQARLVVEFCRHNGLRLVCDEAYGAFRADEIGESGPCDFDPDLATVVLVRSFSKVYSVCGWRIGYVAADADLVSRVTRWQSAILNPPNWIAQHSLVAVPEVTAREISRNRDRVRARLTTLAAALGDAGLEAAPPEGGFYLWIDVRRLLAARGLGSSLDLCLELARDHGIALWPGEDFHGPGFVRASVVGCPDDAWPDAVSRLVSCVRAFTGIDQATTTK